MSVAVPPFSDHFVSGTTAYNNVTGGSDTFEIGGIAIDDYDGTSSGNGVTNVSILGYDFVRSSRR